MFNGDIYHVGASAPDLEGFECGTQRLKAMKWRNKVFQERNQYISL